MKKFLIFVAFLGSLFLWSACGDDKTVYYPSAAVSEVVENFDDLKTCSDKNNGDMVYVRNDLTTYKCELKKWKVFQEYDAVSSSGKGKKSSSSSSDKSSKKSSSSVSSKDASSSSKTMFSSSVDEGSSSSEEGEYSSSSDVVLSSSSAFVCADDWYCSRVEEKCDETVVDSFTVFTYNDKTYYYQCKANGSLDTFHQNVACPSPSTVVSTQDI